MKYIAISLVALAAAASLSHAATTNKQRSLDATPKTEPSIKYSTTPFDTTSEKPLNNYRGHNALEILQKITTPPTKGEFEKTGEHEAKMDKWRDTPFLGSLTPASTFAFEFYEAFSPHAIETQYDADNEELTIRVLLHNAYLEGGSARWLETFSNSKNLGSRIGVTRMGIKFKVTNYVDTKVGLAITGQIEPIAIKIHISSNEAPSIKRNIVGYAIGSLAPPYKVMESRESIASLDEPFETTTNTWGLWLNLKSIWISNRSTGEVIAKINTPFIECKYGICTD